MNSIPYLSNRNSRDVDVPWINQGESRRRKREKSVELHDGRRYLCEKTASKDGKWIISNGKSIDDKLRRLFVRENGQLQATIPIDSHILRSAISNCGNSTVIALEDSGGRMVAFDSTGAIEYESTYTSKPEFVNISNQGKYIVATTLKPDCQTYVYDIQDRSEKFVHENIGGNVYIIDFHLIDKDPVLVFHDRSSNPLYGVNLEGEIFWRCDKLKYAKRPIRISSRISTLLNHRKI